ncbi:MAG: histidine kinase [Streptosporangiaceae bacterium]
MRAVSWAFAVIGGCALVAGVVGQIVDGDPAGAGWYLIGPGPLYAVGLAGAFRGRGHPVAVWLLAAASLFTLDGCLGDLVLQHVGVAAAGWVIFAGMCAGNGSVVAGMGLIGLFPTGRPDRNWQRAVLITAAALALLIPVLVLVASPWMPRSPFSSPDSSAVPSPLFQPAAWPLSDAANLAYQLFLVLILAGLVMLYMRDRRSPDAERRQVRLALVGLTSAAFVFGVLCAVGWLGGDGPGWIATTIALWVTALALLLGSLIVALSPEKLLGIDRSARRSLVSGGLRGLIAVGVVAAAATLGIVASRYMSAGAAILIAFAVVLAAQPFQRRLERFADRWAFGARLDGYEVLARFGAMLENSPGTKDMLTRLADAIRQSLQLQWSRVRLDIVAPSGGRELVGSAGIEAGDLPPPELVVPLSHGGDALGAIECGPRHDGPLLDEDRRLLAHLAGQAAAAVHNLHLSAQLAARLEVIKEQAAELAASRERIVRAQDAERQRIQRDLHDGFQQDLVVLTAKLALAREQLRRADPRGNHALDELQRDLGDALVHLREFAHSIHPPVLADQGLLEAIEAQAARLPVEVVIEADPALRGVRYPRHIEAAGWYVVAEALTNAVKHASARQVVVGLAQPNGALSIEVSDDGCGFDPSSPRGLGLAGLADRIAIVNGELTINSTRGGGTRLRAEVPLNAAASGSAR